MKVPRAPVHKRLEGTVGSMANQDIHVIEHRDGGSGVGTGMIVGIVLVLVLAVIAALMIFGGGFNRSGGAASQTNVNVPAQSAPQVNVPAPQVNVPAPQINVPAPQV